MKIFPTQETSRISDTRSTGEGESVKRKGKKKAAPVKPSISETEIREKLASHVETSNTAKSGIMKKNAQKLGDGFMNPEAKPLMKMEKPAMAEAKEPKAISEEAETEVSKGDAHLLKTDVNLNDPKDPATQEKLKTVLSTGAFNFNPREREALDKILNGN